jgi:hypothetical protein
MWPIIHNLYVIHNNKCFWKHEFHDMLWGVNYSKNIFMFHGECKYLNMMHVLHLNFYHQCEQLCNAFIYLNKYVWHDIVSME